MNRRDRPALSLRAGAEPGRGVGQAELGGGGSPGLHKHLRGRPGTPLNGLAGGERGTPLPSTQRQSWRARILARRIVTRMGQDGVFERSAKTPAAWWSTAQRRGIEPGRRGDASLTVSFAQLSLKLYERGSQFKIARRCTRNTEFFSLLTPYTKSYIYLTDMPVNPPLRLRTEGCSSFISLKPSTICHTASRRWAISRRSILKESIMS